MIEAVETKIGRHRVRLWQGGTGRPLLYLHGFEQHPGPASFLSQLAATRHVHAPEHPGFGRSTGFEDMPEITDLVLHYRALITPIVASEGPIDLIGHSLGGMFAAELAVFCPHLIRKLVLVDPYGLWLDDMPMPDPFAISPAELRQAKWSDPGLWSDKEPNSFRPGDAQSYASYRAQNIGAATRFMWPIPDRGLIRRLPYIAAETLIVHGEQDGLIPAAYAAAFQRSIPAARVSVIAGAGHLPMIEAEPEFLRIVNLFLS
jgi:pimeloyl-ACP methyl ester carboxylesterase